MRKLVRRLAGAAVVVLALTVGGAVGCDLGDGTSCAKDLPAKEATVWTDHHLTEADLPGVGDYPLVHWMGHTSGSLCGGMGPTEWTYQDVIVLRPANATALARNYDFVALGGATTAPPAGDVGDPPVPADILPALAPFLPAEPRWGHSEAYAVAGTQSQRRIVYLDVGHATLLVFTWDS